MSRKERKFAPLPMRWMKGLEHRPSFGHFCDAGGNMIKASQGTHPVILLLIATKLEVSGDADLGRRLPCHRGRRNRRFLESCPMQPEESRQLPQCTISFYVRQRTYNTAVDRLDLRASRGRGYL
jgi:hypothetical protein